MKKIQKIHESELYGCFIETGCGMPVASKLFAFEGAHNTVYMAESPYSVEYQKEQYGDSKSRSVSYETVKNIVDHWKTECSFVLYKENIVPKLQAGGRAINLIYATSFQIGEDKVSHGWIGVAYKEKTFYYHITLDPKPRTELINEIGKIGIRILESILKNNFLPSNCKIDIARDSKGNDIPLSSVFDMMQKDEYETFLTIQNGRMSRLEDVFRGEDSILLYKGSFNPVHNFHQTIAALAEEQYQSKVVFMINMNTYQKGVVPSIELENRIKNITELGYSVIISKDGFFNKNMEYIRSRFPTKKVVFVLGSDTLMRILESSYQFISGNTIVPKFKKDFANAKFFSIERIGSDLSHPLPVEDHIDRIAVDPSPISSTQIRKLKEEKKYDDIKELMPEKIFKNYISQ